MIAMYGRKESIDDYNDRVAVAIMVFCGSPPSLIMVEAKHKEATRGLRSDHMLLGVYVTYNHGYL